MMKQITLFSLLGLISLAHAEVKLASIFSDNAILQRDQEVSVWGWATPGKKITVSFAGQTKKITANKNSGKWTILLDSMPASVENRELTATEEKSNTVTIKNILVGEIWLASGQSNMEWIVENCRAEDKKIASSAPSIPMRLMSVPHVLSSTRQENIVASWVAATPETAKGFSAVGYFFGKKIAEEIKVPVGIINSSWGGSRIEPWFAEEGFKDVPELTDMAKNRAAKSPGFPVYDSAFNTYLTDTKKWNKLAEQKLANGKIANDKPTPPLLLNLAHTGETGTYQAMIHPLIPYAIRGFIWYQGESNVAEGMLYATKMKILINGWRKQFNNLNAPFLYVQIAPYSYFKSWPNNTLTTLPEFWFAQQKALSIPNTGMAITNDVGDINDIHPINKSDVGHRLALWAFDKTYGIKQPAYSGPLYKGNNIEDDKIRIQFDHTGSGLAARENSELTFFEIAGADDVFHPAKVTISDDEQTILLNSENVKQPTQARFAWSEIEKPSLINKEGLPAGAFHTNWLK
jgi:sialate O-acetylesterase